MILMSWPHDKDGILLERLRRDAVNLSKQQYIEFNVDFSCWPPPKEAIEKLEARYGKVKVFEPGQLHFLHEGYVSLRVQAKLSYQLVTTMQQEITDYVKMYGGYCNSWAVIEQKSKR